MTHHYGLVNVDIYNNEFTISLRNNITGAVIKFSGPVEGIFGAKPDKILNESDAEHLGRQIAHFFMSTLE